MPAPPFSARYQSEIAWIDDDFPVEARVGLLHLLRECVELRHLSDWGIIAMELGRLARLPVKTYDPSLAGSISQARSHVETSLNQMRWERVYDFCERMHGHLIEVSLRYRNDDEAPLARAQSQNYIGNELQRLFDEEHLGYDFVEGLVQRRGKLHTVNQMTKAHTVMAAQRLDIARKHFSKAMRFFRDRKEPDFENVVKEAVCAVEAAAKELFPEAKSSTLGDFLNWASAKERLIIPKTISQSFSGLYGFRNSGEGIAHGGSSGGIVTSEIAQYVLAVTASQIILLTELAVEAQKPPF